VVARHVEHGNVEPAHQVLEVVEGQVAAADDDIGTDLGEPIAIERLVDLVGDGEDSRGQWPARSS
jgi:hypothetical protein